MGDGALTVPSMCLMVCEESSQRPVWRATMLAVVEEPLIRPTDDILCPVCCSTCPFICTENTSGSELIPNRCRLTEAWAHTLTSGQKRGNCWSLGVFYLYLCRTCRMSFHWVYITDNVASIIHHKSVHVSSGWRRIHIIHLSQEFEISNKKSVYRSQAKMPKVL